MFVYAVGCSGSTGDGGVVLYAPTLAQAFEATEEVLREQACRPGSGDRTAAFGAALADLRAEGAQDWGWWAEVEGLEVWYGPVSAAVPAGVAAGELALLASIATCPPAPVGVLADAAATTGACAAPERRRGDGFRPRNERRPAGAVGPDDRLGLRAQCRTDGPGLRAGHLGVAVHTGTGALAGPVAAEPLDARSDDAVAALATL